jgi:peptide-methionine (S)-S-oxide reductase
MEDEMSETTEIADLGGGCFWCLEAVFQRLKGVRQVVSGYAGGSVPNPTYRQVCAGDTGHAEMVRVSFNPAELSFADLLRVFFTIHDPTTPNRQGADVGTQYRSIILTQDEDQARVARQVMDELQAEKLYPAPFVTELVPAAQFYPAEDYHQNYFRKNPGAGYCQAVVAPKVAKFRARFADRLVD